MSDIEPRFVFVVGCQRSGTTLMGQIIGAHSQALLVDETDSVYDWAASVLESNDESASRYEINQLRERALKKYRDRDLLQRENNHVLVLQAPNLTFHHHEISRALPGSRVVYMNRDVRAVVASMLRLPQIQFVRNQIRFFRQAGFIEHDFPNEWSRLVDDETSMPVKMALVAKIKMSLAANFQNAGIPVLTVKYEDLVASPEPVIKTICQHIDLPFDRKCLGHDRLLQGHGPGGTDRGRPLDQGSLSNWKEQLPAETIDAIWTEVGGFYEGLGYEKEATQMTET